MTIAVTGYGLITAVGDDAHACWQALTAAQTGIGENTIVPSRGVMSDRAGQVRSLEERDNEPEDRSIRLGVRALAEALACAGLTTGSYEPARMALSLGTSLGAARQGQRFHQDWIERGLENTRRSDLLDYPLHALADALGARFVLNGPRVVHSNACAAGAVAIANGFEFLRDDLADVAVVGGVDPLAYLSFGGFSSLGVLSLANCAPYTRSDGITLGEGAGFLILEDRQKAERRGATIYAELLGYGLTADAYHPTAPDPRGRGAVAAMQQALTMAGVDSSRVSYVNGHGTGTPANDSLESRTIQTLGNGHIPMSSTKSMTGHTLGAAGAVEAIVSVLSIVHQRLHPTYVPADEAAQQAARALGEQGTVDIVAQTARDAEVRYVLSNSFAFGGNNASLLFGAPDAGEGPDHAPRRPSDRGTIAVTGASALAGSATDTEELRNRLASDRAVTDGSSAILGEPLLPVGRADDKALLAGINPRVVRRLDRLSLLASQAARQLIRDTGLQPKELADTGLIMATSTGPLQTVERFQRELLVEGEADGKLFPNTVMNAAAGHVALMFGLHGPTATICSGWTSGVSALHLGQQVIRNGACSRVIVIAADEAGDALLAGYSRFPGFLSTGRGIPNGDTGVVFSEGAVALLLEADAVSAPSRPSLARLLGFGLASNQVGPGRMGGPETCLRAFGTALGQAGITADQLDVVVSAAAGRERVDRVERAALAELPLADRAIVLHPKELTGETQSAAPLLGILQARWAFEGAAHTAVAPAEGDRYALISNTGIGGTHQCVVVRF